MAGTWSLRQLFSNRASRVEHSCELADRNGLIEIGHFRIDTIRRSGTLLGEELGLTSDEFEVLMFLTTHQQRFVTPGTMLATSWSSEVHQTDFLKALLGLRRKIAAVSPAKPYLRTEPWVVYRFDPGSSLAG